MNKELQDYARSKIKEGLSILTDGHRMLFKRMYSPNDLGKDIGAVVDDMPTDKLDWAMQQIENTKGD